MNVNDRTIVVGAAIMSWVHPTAPGTASIAKMQKDRRNTVANSSYEVRRKIVGG